MRNVTDGPKVLLLLPIYTDENNYYHYEIRDEEGYQYDILALSARAGHYHQGRRVLRPCVVSTTSLPSKYQKQLEAAATNGEAWTSSTV